MNFNVNKYLGMEIFWKKTSNQVKCADIKYLQYNMEDARQLSPNQPKQKQKTKKDSKTLRRSVHSKLEGRIESSEMFAHVKMTK